MSRVYRISTNATVTITGMEELEQKMRAAVKVYPDITYEVVKKCGEKLKKDLKEETDAAGVGVITGNLKAGYSTRVPSNRTGMDVASYLMAETKKNPHFHLIEHGHRMVPRGPAKRPGVQKDKSNKAKEGTGGRGVAGYHMAEKAISEYAPKHPKFAMEAMEKILSRAGL